MMRRPAFAAVWAVALSACALDMGGLGADLPAEGGVAGTASFEASSGDESIAEPESADGSEVDAQGVATDAQGASPDSGMSASDAPAAPDGPPGEAGSPCDQDGDGYLAVGACGGNDCCDQDAHVHPGETSYYTKPGACGGYDYDCDGKESAEYGAVDCQWSAFSCSGDGFAAPIPTCGATGTFTSCSIPWYDVFSCTGDNAQQTQACR